MPENISQSVGSKLMVKTAEFTRPANVTAYTAGDVVSNDATTTVLMVFGPGLVRFEGGSGLIVKARLTTDNNAETAQYRLFLYTKSEASVTIPADNAPDTMLYADRTKLIGYLDFPAVAKSVGTSTAASAVWTGGPSSVVGPMPFVCDSTKAGNPLVAETSIYGKLVNMTGTTPANAQKFSVELTVLQN